MAYKTVMYTKGIVLEGDCFEVRTDDYTSTIWILILISVTYNSGNKLHFLI
jgi:hypothetical protein